MNKVYLLLGSNMGNSLHQLKMATRYIGEKAGKVNRMSAFYTTAAWGNTDQPDFLNQVIVIETTMDANKLLQTTLSIEKKWAAFVQLRMPRGSSTSISCFSTKPLYANPISLSPTRRYSTAVLY